MTQEQYLQLKKEYHRRAILVIVLFVTGSILYSLVVISGARHIPYLLAFGAAVVPVNYGLLVPSWELKKKTEGEHPEWTKLSTRGIKISSQEANKRYIATLVAFAVLIFSFVALYKPAKRVDVNVNTNTSQIETSDSSEEENTETTLYTTDITLSSSDEVINKTIDSAMEKLLQKNQQSSASETVNE